MNAPQHTREKEHAPAIKMLCVVSEVPQCVLLGKQQVRKRERESERESNQVCSSGQQRSRRAYRPSGIHIIRQAFSGMNKNNLRSQRETERRRILEDPEELRELGKKMKERGFWLSKLTLSL